MQSTGGKRSFLNQAFVDGDRLGLDTSKMPYIQKMDSLDFAEDLLCNHFFGANSHRLNLNFWPVFKYSLAINLIVLKVAVIKPLLESNI